MPNQVYNIPGYGAYVARREQQAQQQLGDIQKAGVLLAIKERMEAQKAAQAQQDMFQQSGGDLSKAMEAALRSGNVDAASKIARIIESQKVSEAPKGYGPGTQILGPDGKVVHTVPFAPRTEPNPPPEVALVNFYNGLPDTDPRKPLIKRFIEKKTDQERTYPTISTPEGVFERTPGGLRRLTAPDTRQPLTQPNGAADGLTPENAGKVAMVKQSVDSIREVRGKLFNNVGDLNRGLVAALNVPYFAGLPGNSDARSVRSKIYNAIEAKLRIETGAAATEPEVRRVAARFLPTLADTAESARQKLDDLEAFFTTSLSMTKGIPEQKPSGGNVVDFGSLK